MQECVVRAEKIVAEGRALARVDGLVVFVEGLLPGELARVRLTQRKKSFAFAQILEVLEPSADRVTPRCPVFGRCGGCAFQHLAYPAQLRAKHGVVREALHGITDQVAEPLGVAEPWYFRNKMGFAFGVEDGKPVVGLHPRGDWRRVISASDCWLQSPESRVLLRRLAEFVDAEGIAVYDEESGEGDIRHVVIREGKRTGERMVHLHSARPHPAFDRLRVEDLAMTGVLSVHTGVPESAQPEQTRVLWGPGVIRERLNGFVFEIGPLTFFQTNTEQAERLFALVRDWAAASGVRKAVDLYAGTAPIALHLATVVPEVMAIESQGAAVQTALRNAAANGLERVRVRQVPVESARDLLLAERPELIVVDPPRAGLHPRAMSALEAASAPHLIYVSCNPATLARDLARLVAGGYRVEAVQPVDMFPHTFHIEVAVLLRK